MPVYLIALTAAGGVPIFSRSLGDSQLSYPVIGSLNGIHMYGKGGGLELTAAFSDTYNIAWKAFYDSISLILVSDKTVYSQNQLENLLKLICGSLLMLYGSEAMSTIKNIERFKREIRVCYGLLDYILNLYKTATFSDITQCIDVLASNSSDLMQNYLNVFTESASSLHGCLLVEGRVLVSTPEWFNLDIEDRSLLCHLINSLPRTSAVRDLPIYLPKTSPKVPQRLVTITLIPGVEICLLCGPTPSLDQLEKEVERFWSSAAETLKKIKSQIMNIPNDTSLDPNILGFVFMNSITGKSITYYQRNVGDFIQQHGDNSEIEARRLALRNFISTTATVIPSISHTSAEEDMIKPTESYMCTDFHKAYAIYQPPYHVYFIYSNRTPIYALSSTAKDTLSMLIKEKFI